MGMPVRHSQASPQAVQFRGSRASNAQATISMPSIEPSRVRRWYSQMDLPLLAMRLWPGGAAGNLT